MTAATKTYGVGEYPETDDVPAGCERISLVTDDRNGAGMLQIEDEDGSLYLCDADGDRIDDCSSWTLQRVLADIRAGDPDSFFEAVGAAAKS